MRIGFDAKRAFTNTSGLGNYSRFVISGLQHLFPEENYLLYTPFLPASFPPFFTSSAKIAVKMPNGVQNFWPGLWRSKGINRDLKQDQVQLYHGLSNELPYGLATSIKTVVTIHDLIFLRYPELYNTPDRLVYNHKFKYACKRADKIVAISEQTKGDIIQYFNIEPTQIDVIYQDCNPLFQHKATPDILNAVKQKYQLPDQYILCVGTLEARKNQLNLIKAWHQANLQKEIPIVLVGRTTAYKQEIENYLTTHGLKKAVRFLPYIQTEELPAIYQLAHLFVYPSIFEGFGIPLVEALNSGVPLITSSGSCFAEAGGPESRYVEPNNISELSAQLQTVLTDSTLRQKMIAAGYEHALRFRPEKTITQLYSLYQQLVTG